jgi:sucrose-6-phosphate hydrolase SacC (GH32 family)
VRLEVHGVAVVYDTQGQSLRCKDHSVEMPLENGRLDLRILVDRASLEVFAGGGRVYLPLSLVYPEGRQDLSLTASGGSAWLERLELRKLRCIW